MNSIWVVFTYTTGGTRWFAGVYNNYEIAEQRASRLEREWWKTEIQHCASWEPEKPFPV